MNTLDKIVTFQELFDLINGLDSSLTREELQEIIDKGDCNYQD